jgi:dephospho-CoA kinase
MGDRKNWEKIVRRMEQLLRLKSFPVAFKMLEGKEELNTIPFMRRPKHRITLCQLVSLVRNFDWTVGAEVEDFLFPTCSSIIGLSDIPEFYKDGAFRSIVWVKNREDAKRYEASIPRLPLGKYEAVALAPLVYNPFDPEIVLIYANPAQMILLINALQVEDYEVMNFYCVGESSCSDAIARCYLTDKPSLTIPCYGERRYGHAQDDEMVMAVPANKMEKALKGLETLYRRGVRYPISFAGAELELGQTFPPSYNEVTTLKKIKGKANILLLAVTGGIATGKSTVSQMLEDLGAPLIDFDVLAREVVEPGKPAWEEIVEFFGRQVLQGDDRIDRKKLSEIVFRDMEKRKKLEAFTHPRIFEEFHRQVEHIAAKNPDAVIQAGIPLLIELNLQYRFDKVLLVYIPQENQIERVMKRDGISREAAVNILKAQIPIEEKVGYADFVIHNERRLEGTRKQVEEVWKELKRIQKAKGVRQKTSLQKRERGRNAPKHRK